MKKLYLIIILICLIASQVSGQRSIKGFEDFSEYRDIGELRFWTYIVSDSVVGTLISTVVETTTIDGIPGYKIEEKLKLDYNKVNIALSMDIRNEHSVSKKGYHLGDKMSLKINDQNEELSVFKKDNLLKGYITRGGTKDDVSLEFDNEVYSIENNYFDQLEIYLASKDMTVGTVFQDSFYMPQSMVYNHILGQVMEFENSQLYNEVFDSSFVIEFTKPFEQLVYFTPDKRLVKVNIPSQNLKVYLDAVRNPQKARSTFEKLAEQKGQFLEKTFAKNHIWSFLGSVFLYFVFGVISILFFIRSGYKSKDTYLAFLSGCIVFIVLPLTQIPLQNYLQNNIFVPQITSGGSAFIWGVIPTLPVGIIQELLKIVTILLFVKLIPSKKYQIAVIGAAIGFGLGFLEASYLAWNTPVQVLFGINLVEKGFLILFHVASGALLGYILSKGIVRVVPWALLTIFLNAFFRYLPIFAKERVLTPELLTIILALTTLVFLSIVILFFKDKETR